MRGSMLTAASALVLALISPPPTSASQCPALMARIDQLAGSAEITDEEREYVQTLRMQGEELHAEGAHEDAVAVLEHALELLPAD